MGGVPGPRGCIPGSRGCTWSTGGVPGPRGVYLVPGRGVPGPRGDVPGPGGGYLVNGGMGVYLVPGGVPGTTSPVDRQMPVKTTFATSLRTVITQTKLKRNFDVSILTGFIHQRKKLERCR